jgi:hypothetical protein
LISATRLSRQPDIEGLRRRGPRPMEVETTAAQRADPTPFPHQSSIAEQRRFDREDIETRDIAARIPRLEQEHLQFIVRDVLDFAHRAILARVRGDVQRKTRINRAPMIRVVDRSQIGREDCVSLKGRGKFASVIVTRRSMTCSNVVTRRSGLRSSSAISKRRMEDRRI